MTGGVRLGEASDGRALTIDVGSLVHLLLTGSSGSGKSTALRGVLERTKGRVQQVVLDYEGEFSTLRDEYDYVLVAEDGDLKPNAAAAGLLVRKLMEVRADAILDVSELPPKERHEFARRLFEGFINLPRNLWHDVLLVVDEAHYFAPEAGKVRDTSVARDALVDLAARGRKRGVHLVVATQRLAKLSKDVAAECQDKLVGRTNLSEDRKRAIEELAAGRDERSNLLHEIASLKAGTFYAVGRALGLPEVSKVRLDLPKTKAPARGEGARPPPPPRGGVLQALAELRDLPQKAEDEARSLEEAQARIRELQRQLRTTEKAAPAPERVPDADVERRVREAVARAVVEHEAHLRSVEAASAARDRDWRAVWAQAQETLEIARQALERFPDAPGEALTIPSPPTMRAIEREERAPPMPSGGKRSRAERLLDTLAELSAVPGLEVTTASLAAVYGVHPRGGSYLQELKNLQDQGLIERSRERVTITPAGLRAARPRPPPASAEEVIEQANVSERTRRVFRVIAERGEATKEEIAEAIGVHPRGGSFLQEFKKLADRGLIEDPGRGGPVRIAAWIRRLEGAP